MDELKRILKLAISERTESDKLYLKSHESELTDEQKAQLETEKVAPMEMCKMPDETKKECVVRTLPQVMKDNPDKSEEECTVMAEKMCSVDCKKESDKNIAEEHVSAFAKKELAKKEAKINESFSEKIKLAKEEGKYQTRAFKSEVKDLGEGMMEAIISSESLDRHGEIVDMKGMNIKEYMLNPIVADGHDYSKPSVGRTHKLTKTKDGLLIAVFEWAKDITDRANELYKLYKNGFQFAFSIGFMVDDMVDNVFIKSTMLEFSPVLIPANPEALLLAKQKGLDKNLIINYNNINMYKLKDVVAKDLKDLTVGEISFLKESKKELSAEQLEKFASILKDENLTAEGIKGIIESVVSGIKADLKAIKDADPVEKAKNINLGYRYDSAVNFKNAPAELQKKLKFLYYVKGVQDKNFSTFERIVGKDAMNTTDDNVVLPPIEFLAEVERLEEQYGVARKFATIKQGTSGNGIKYVQGDDDVEVFMTDEHGIKKSTKLSYKELDLLWRKATAILPITDELTEDSAINLWADATNRFARAYAKKEDELVFTQVAGASPIKPGILEVTGTNVVTMSGTGSDDSFADISYDDLVDMITGVPTPSAANGRFYFHREILGYLMKLKDDDGRPLWLQGVQTGAPATILGKPYELVEVMPKLSDDAPSKKFMIFGDLKYSTLGERSGLVIKIFDTGTVGDPDEVDQDTNTINLLREDVQAMRAVKRLNAVCRFPAAFSVLKTATSGS